MGRAKHLAQQITALDEPIAQDFDPEEDAPVLEGDEESDSEESDDGLAGTEHYSTVGKSKLRKSDEINLGPEYSGSRVSRQALLDDDEEEQEVEMTSESNYDSASEKVEEPEGITFADPEAVDVDLDDEDGDIDSDNAFGESDEEKFQAFTFPGSSKPKSAKVARQRATAADFMSDSENEGVPVNVNESESDESDEDLLDVADQHSDDEEDEEESVSGNESTESSGDQLDDESEPSDGEETGDESKSGSEHEDDEKTQRAELRKIMGEEQKTVIATISQAAKVDADKGNAVKEQRKAFDSLLSVRMVLQKALVATNSMAAVEEKWTDESANQPYEAAEEAAIKLWNTLDGLRHELSKANSGVKTGQKRKRGVETSTPSATLWERMQGSEVSVIDNRQTTLEKWSAKVRSATSLPISRKLNPAAAQQSITSLIQDQLANSDHLVKRTKMPRSCAPLQRDQKVTEDPDIYDDGNFYQLLLKELVDQRRIDSLTTPVNGGNAGKAMQWIAVKEAKTRKNVDTKASKGRKMRFTVHEKLQNFMAPEDRGTWEPAAIDRFFGTLLGQKMTLGEEEASDDGEGENGFSLEEEGLMLFRS
ncbi:TRAUB-domain-containing protein [Hyaloscypha variabilis F]|uniref:Protein BFR2 n=1 Tax=Hyaloscypha variabilis (strain UAMH 11265 / GT02V1 / F) TaxID=1149755 RepID=A0A2J6R9M4_HYAVF|nr:TRAUB-domain-containing protein [Hyaloscypha variabilis F]